MSAGDTYRMTLMRACVLVGSEQQLARKFGVPEKRIAEWLLGEVPLPDDIFLQAVDIVLAYNTQR
jgi:DNA-binding transcriptional regulator YdaS (Cro superfamily)